MGSLVSQGYLTSSSSLREVFFSEGTDEAELDRIQALLNEHSTPMLLNDDVKLLGVRCVRTNSRFLAVYYTVHGRSSSSLN